MKLRPGPVVCVSYLALAELWTVPRFPTANHGVEIRSIEWSIAADGPMTAAALASLGAPTLLISNEIGDDEHGRQVRQWLRQNQVESGCTTSAEVITLRIVVAADDNDTRTWFAHLPGVVESLACADLSSLISASFIYLDCYQLIEASAVRVIEAARAAKVPLLVNLGGSELSPTVGSAVRGCSNLLIQTNVDDAAHAQASTVARSLLAQTSATWVVVTAGAFGVVAVSQTELVSVPAFPVIVHHTHCAGAAFSGGLLYGLRAGCSMVESMFLGSASGALRCERSHSAPLPTLAELQAVIVSREH
jgi:sugar/nucleoside kinase (ribokinase family)